MKTHPLHRYSNRVTWFWWPRTSGVRGETLPPLLGTFRWSRALISYICERRKIRVYCLDLLKEAPSRSIWRGCGQRKRIRTNYPRLAVRFDLCHAQQDAKKSKTAFNGYFYDSGSPLFLGILDTRFLRPAF